MKCRCLAVVVALFATLLIGCVGSISHDAYVVDIENNIWDKVAVVEIQNEDTLSLRDISIFIKHQQYEGLDSLPLTIYTVAPDEVIFEERRTIHIEGCRRGEYVASHLHEMPYRRDIKLRQRGVYKIYLFPQMPIRGVEGVGVTIK